MEKLFSLFSVFAWRGGKNWNIAPVNCDNWRNWEREQGEEEEEEDVERGEISDMNNTPAFQKRQRYLPRQTWWCSDCMNMLVGIRPCSGGSCVDVKYAMLCENNRMCKPCQTLENEESVAPVSWNRYKSCHYTNREVYRDDLLHEEGKKKESPTKWNVCLNLKKLVSGPP